MVKSDKKTNNAVIYELDIYEEKELLKNISKSGSPQWLYHFITRVRALSYEKGLSQQKLLQACNANNQKEGRVSPSFVLRKSTLSNCINYTNPTHIPSSELIITLADVFNVSIDYLMGRTDCRNPKYEKAHACTGLSEISLKNLSLKKALAQNASYRRDNLYEERLLFMHDPKAYEEFLSKPYIATYSSDINGVTITKTIDEIKSDVDTIAKTFSDIIDADKSDLEASDAKDILKDHVPHTHFFDVLDALITYKKGYFLNLLADYLFRKNQEVNIKAPEIYEPADFIEDSCGLPYIETTELMTNMMSDPIYLAKIQTELEQLHQHLETSDSSR